MRQAISFLLMRWFKPKPEEVLPIEVAVVGLEPHLARLIRSNLRRQRHIDTLSLQSLEEVKQAFSDSPPAGIIISLTDLGSDQNFRDQVRIIPGWESVSVFNLKH